MESLDLLWQLQKHDNTLKNIKNKIEEITKGEKLKLISDKLNETENKLNDLESRLEENEKKLNNNNFVLKNLDFELKEIENDLYKGDIADLKQLGYLDKEREIVKEQIDKKEMEILSQMEDMEELKTEFIKIEGDFKSLRIEYTQLIKEYRVMVEELKERAIQEKKEKDILLSKIDKDILDKYIKISKIKGSVVVEVVDNKCSGCNMLLPIFIIDKLKEHNGIIYCENCGRILHFPE